MVLEAGQEMDGMGMGMERGGCLCDISLWGLSGEEGKEGDRRGHTGVRAKLSFGLASSSSHRWTSLPARLL